MLALAPSHRMRRDITEAGWPKEHVEIGIRRNLGIQPSQAWAQLQIVAFQMEDQCRLFGRRGAVPAGAEQAGHHEHALVRSHGFLREMAQPYSCRRILFERLRRELIRAQHARECDDLTGWIANAVE